MDVFLSTMAADALPPPLRLFWRSELFAELAALEDALFAGHPVPRTEPRIDDQDWHLFMTGFLNSVASETDGPDRSPATLPRSPGARALRWRVRQTLEALATLPFQDAPTGLPPGILPSHTVLLPAHRRERLALLLGHGVLPMAWVHQVPVQRFRAPQQRPQLPE